MITFKFLVTLLIFIIFDVDVICSKSREHRNLLILLDQQDIAENVGRSWRFYLMSRLQSAVASQAVPILLNESLWNSFVERRIVFEQALKQEKSREHKILDTYQQINKQLNYWHHYYSQDSDDIIQNKELMAQRVSEEFYNDSKSECTGTSDERIKVEEHEYQALINFLTPFNPADWLIYTNKKGFYLLIPQKYVQDVKNTTVKTDNESLLLGFRLHTLTRLTDPEDNGAIFFDSRDHAHANLIDSLPDFLMMNHEFTDGVMPYSWNVVCSGHGGSHYNELLKNDTVTFHAEPIIADLSVTQFEALLEFLQSKISTNLFHYSACYAGGHHIKLVFDKAGANKIYNYAIFCDGLTDNYSYCKWKTMMPCQSKKFLKVDDLTYDVTKQEWQLLIDSPYRWGEFFKNISAIDLESGPLDQLYQVLSAITYDSLEDISQLRLPGSHNFYPIYPPRFSKINDRVVTMSQKQQKPISLQLIRVLLLESSSVMTEVVLENSKNEAPRIISIIPGSAVHHINKLKSNTYLDLINVFWQVEGQLYNKVFLIDECIFPHACHSLVFKKITTGDEIILKNVLIITQKDHIIRVVFSIGEDVLMVVGHKVDSLDDNVTIQEVVKLTSAARLKYLEQYSALKSVNQTIPQQLGG